MTTWIYDDAGNRASVEYWGSEDKARASLATLHNSTYCTDCAGCTDCYDCTDCDDCARCTGCTGCTLCTDCNSCTNSIGCTLIARKDTAVSETGHVDIPAIANIHQTIYAAASQPGALDMNDWHTCANTHCRAGWAVALAGDAGRALEGEFGTPLAATLIYEASGYPIDSARFYETNEAALADMKRLAEGDQG